ncbi:MAG: polyketide synthase [Mesorhizobium amorphae]|nr:MAG: polyketide synthase [Mesorhizobium amorphae]
MLDNTNGSSPSDIAIVGMALRVPGARNVDDFWQNLRSGTESIRDLSEEELAASGEAPERLHHPHYVARTAELPGMEMFDAEFFGLSPKEAAVMDPQHRHFLECAWEAMEDAGRMPETGGPVGVFAGCGMGSYFYFNVCSNRALVDQVGMFLLRHTGNDKDFLSTRASFTFDLRGPSVGVQTACSTSLVAIHYACQSLLNGECDMALAGGVTIELPHRRGYIFQEGEILAPDGRCRPFDHRAAGTVFGSGVGLVALRRLSDALADGDHIHAVIKATAINNDGGSKAGYLAPSLDGQAEAIVEAQGLAGIAADTIGYVECHGTGTAIGDPIEIEALTQAFRQSTDRRGFCLVGSVKSNIGHLDTAAGVVGVIKAALAVKHGEIPPTLGFERANPAIDFAASPFSVCSRLTDWPALGGRRRAAVNSLGVGGTNAHAILEQAPFRPGGERHAPDAPVLLTLSARQPAGLDQAADTLSRWLANRSGARLEDVAFSLWNGRRRFDHTRVVAVRDRADAIAALLDKKRAQAQAKRDPASGAVFMFPGGGAQHHAMAEGLYRRDPFFRAVVDEGLGYLPDEAASEIRGAWLGEDAKADRSDPLLRPSVQLPAILIVEVAVARMWMRAGVAPAALIGHSMGENAAACIAGVFDFADAVRLVRLRGELFDTIPRGGMLGVPLSAEELRAILPPALDIASLNAPSLSVVSGRDADLSDFAVALEAKGITATRIPIDIAAHSRMLDAILPRWEAFLRSLTLRAPRIPIVSNLSGEWLTAAQATDPLYWVRHLRSTVRWADGMAKLMADPTRVYIDVGPGKVASSLAKAQGVPTMGDRVINSLPHPDEKGDEDLHILAAFGRAALSGLPVELSLLWGGGEAQRQSLPTYSFQHKRFFIEPARDTGAADAAPVLARRPDMARWGYRPVWKQSLPDYEAGCEAATRSWLVFLDEAGIGNAFVARLKGANHEVTTVSRGDAFRRRAGDDYALCPELGAAGYQALVAGLVADGRLPQRVLHLWLAGAGSTARAGSDPFHQNLDCGFHSLFHLANALGDAEPADPIHFTVVTDGMHRVGSEPLPYPEKATVLGPALVLPREMRGASVRVIDLDASGVQQPTSRWMPSRAATPAGDLEMLWQDAVGEPGSEIVAYRQKKRWTRSHKPFALDEALAEHAPIRHGGTYLFTGGLGDLAASLAGDLATRFDAKLVLVGRAKLPPREAWLAHLRQHAQDAVSRGIETILGLEAKGADVLYCRADVTNQQEMEAAVASALARFGRIDGAFHTAGRVDDALMQGKAVERMEAVLAPKLVGTRVLDAVLQGTEAAFLVLFSSTSTITAPAGQVDYVAANAYLNAFADSRSRRTVSLHWGIWDETGLAARGTGSKKREASIAEGPAAGPFFTHWACDGEDGSIWLQAVIAPSTHWMLDEHRLVSGEAVLPGTAYLELIAQAAREHGIGAVEIRDLVFLKPLLVADGAGTTLQLSVQRSGAGWRIAIRAGEPGRWARHAEAEIAALSEAASRIDTDALARRLPAPVSAAGGEALTSAQEHHIRFGARWRTLRAAAFGDTEALATLSLDPAHCADIAMGILTHPALLDIATGFAMPLVEAFRSADVLWAPASYGVVRLHAPLPERVVSHIRLVAGHDFGPDYAAFDITIADASGRVVFEAERFLMKKLADDSAFAQASQRPAARTSGPEQAATPAMLRLAAQVRQGIRPAEGLDALLRALGSGLSQPVVSSLDLDALVAAAAAVPETSSEAVAAFERPDSGADFVAARDPVEAKLAGFWQELLGVSRVGVDDSFFDLGGHSLIAVRLFRMIKKEFGLDLPISTLFAAPTVAQCAAVLREQAPAIAGDADMAAPAVAPARHVHLTVMHPGRKPDAVPLFVCAGMFGNILNLRHLALHLGEDRPVYGLQARGLFGDMAPHETFEEMAADYLAEIRAVRAHGPYLLAGYSGGGITAFEMARQLSADGEDVPLVVMLDTPQPTQRPLSLADKLSMKTQDLRRQRLGYLNSWLKERAAWSAELRRKREAAEATADTPPDAFSNDRIEGAFRRALGRYTVPAAAWPVTVYRPQPLVHYRLSGGRRLMANRDMILDDNGWGAHVHSLETVEVPGDHDTMVLEPHVRVLAGNMRQALVAALSPTSPAVSQRSEKQTQLVAG